MSLLCLPSENEKGEVENMTSLQQWQDRQIKEYSFAPEHLQKLHIREENIAFKNLGGLHVRKFLGTKQKRICNEQQLFAKAQPENQVLEMLI